MQLASNILDLIEDNGEKLNSWIRWGSTLRLFILEVTIFIPYFSLPFPYNEGKYNLHFVNK